MCWKEPDCPIINGKPAGQKLFVIHAPRGHKQPPDVLGIAGQFFFYRMIDVPDTKKSVSGRYDADDYRRENPDFLSQIQVLRTRY